MNRVKWFFCMMCVVGCGWACADSVKADETLGRYGQTEVTHPSLDGLKPFVVASVGEAKAFGVTWDKMLVLKAAYQMLESQKADDRQRSGKFLVEYQPLVELFFQWDTARPMGLILFADAEMIYPAVFFPVKGNFEPVDLRTVKMHNRLWLHLSDDDDGLLKEDFLWWGTRGDHVFVTVKPLSQAMPDDLATFCERHFAEPDAQAKLEVNFADAPEYLVFGLIQIADFALQYGEGVTVVQNYFNRYGGYGPLSDLTSNESMRQTTRAWLHEVRDYFRQIRQYKATVAFADSGDFVITSAIDFVPDTDMWRQMNARKNQRQSLHGFYQPENAVFAVGEGGVLRPRQQKMLTGLWDGVEGDMLDMTKWQLKMLEESLADLKPREELAGENSKLAEVIANIDFSTADANNPAMQAVTTPFGTFDQPLHIEENRPYFEKQLAETRVMHESTQQLRDFVAAVIAQSSQEGAATLGDDHNFIAAARIAEGRKLRDFFMSVIPQVSGGSNNPYQIETDLPEYKGFHFINITGPIIPDDILELKPSDHIRRNVKIKFDAEEKRDGTPMPVTQQPYGGGTIPLSHAGTVPVTVGVVESEQPMYVPVDAEEQTVVDSEQPVAVPAGQLVPTESVRMYPLGLSQEEYEKTIERFRISEEKAEQLALERRRKAMENMPEAMKNRRGQICIGISDGVICIAVGLDADDPAKALRDAIDRCEKPQEFGATLMVFRPRKMGEMFQYLAPLMLEASDADYHDFVKELLALSPETTVEATSRFTETGRIDTLTIGREYFDFYRKKFPQQENHRQSVTAPLFPSYLTEGGFYEVDLTTP